MRSTCTNGILWTLAVGMIVFTGCGKDLSGLDRGTSGDDGPALGTQDGPLALRAITPTRGLVESNTIVMIEGEGFAPGAQVFFGDLSAKEVQVLTDGILTAMTPVLPIGTVDVRVRSQLQGQVYEVALAEGFDTFMLPAGGGRAIDSDGDGLSDAEEIAGWDIKVDIFGFGLDPGQLGTYLQHHVDSDPNVIDTDGDGLADGDEYLVKTNPRAVDTDGDRLWDGEEWFRWLTSPVSIDSDGDARSADPSSPFSTLPPNASLFDGAELYDSTELLKDPVDRVDIKFNATSPTLDDTDGDNVRDTDEIDTPVRTPLLADMPQLLFEIVDDVDIRLDVEYAEEEGKTTAFETSFTTGESRSKTESQSNTVSASVTVGVEVEASADPSVTGSVEVTAGYEHGWESTTESTKFSEETFSQMEEKSRAFTETAATGSMLAGIKVSNIGNITVQVVDLGFTVRQWQATSDPSDTSPGEYKTFASLGVDLGPGLTLSPGADSGVLLASAEDINADRVKAFMAKPDSLQIEPAAFELINDQGLNFAFIQEVTQARTARVSIDFGDGTFEEYRIATNVDRNADSTLAGIKMSKVLDLTVGVGNWETRVVMPPCDAPVTNGSFESPQNSGVPDDWNVRDIGGANGEVSVAELTEPPPPDGVQWVEFRSTTTDAKAISQMIGTVQDNTDHAYGLVVALEDSPPGDYSVSIWAGDPAGGGTLLDEDVLTADTGIPDLVSGTLNTGTGHEGAALYVELRAISDPGGATIILMDDLQVTGAGASLWSVRDVETDLDVPRFWMVFLSEDLSLDAAQFEDIVLRNGESVLLSLTQDSDRDGLYAAQEQQYGSSDATADTDGDGIPDPIESARQYIDPDTCELLDGGWVVKITPASGDPVEFRAYSNPTVEDSDGDGLTDYDEWVGADGFEPGHPSDTEDATNPLSRDSDGDGLFDPDDPFPTGEAITLYVDAAATGAGDGLSWDDAYTSLAAAMDEADDRNETPTATDDVAEIWVASGSYPLTNQLLPRNANIYGGFAGNETELGQRVADGTINGTFITQGTPGEYMLTTLTSPAIFVRLDGFTLQGADKSAIRLGDEESTVEIANCFFFGNVMTSPYQLYGGAAIYSSRTNLTIEDCIFSDNQVVGGAAATDLLGGAVSVSEGQLVIRRCTFSRNSCAPGDTATENAYGGALCVKSASATLIEDSRFLNNFLLERAEGAGYSYQLRGGAVYLSATEATVRNTTFEENEVNFNENILDIAWDHSRAGGGVAVASSDVNFVNCLFRGNRASMFGGGLFVGSAATSKVVNCTFYGNEAYPDLESGEEIKSDRNCDNENPIRPIAVGGAIGASGTVIADNTVFWNNVGTEVVTEKLHKCRKEWVIVFLDIEQQICTKPGQILTGRSKKGCGHQDNGRCLSSGGSITYDNCAIHIKAISFKFKKDNNWYYGDGGADFAGMLEGTGNIFPTSAGFVDASGGDLRLSVSSLLIDAGNQFADADIIEAGFQALPDFDLDGNFRITDGDGDGIEDVDIGAYEYQGD